MRTRETTKGSSGPSAPKLLRDKVPQELLEKYPAVFSLCTQVDAKPVDVAGGSKKPSAVVKAASSSCPAMELDEEQLNGIWEQVAEERAALRGDDAGGDLFRVRPLVGAWAAAHAGVH